MKSLIILASLFSLNAFAVDNITFQIDRLNFSGDRGSVISKNISIGSGSDSIGFNSATELFHGTIVIKDKVLEIAAENGMFIKSSSPLDLKDIPETVVENGVFFSEPTKLGLKANFLSTSISNILLEVGQLDFNCNEGGSCNARANKMVVDSNMLITKPEFTCTKANCIEDFVLNVSGMDDGKIFVVRNVSTRAFVDLKDLTGLTFKRSGKYLSLTGRVKVLLARLGFELKAEIVRLDQDILELHVNKVVISDFLSVTDFTMFLAKKILSTKSFTMNGDNLIIKLR